MPGYKKKADKEAKTAQRKFKREKRQASEGGGDLVGNLASFLKKTKAYIYKTDQIAN